MSINTDSVLAKANDFLKSSAGKERVKNFVKEHVSDGTIVRSPEEAAQKFIEIMHGAAADASVNVGQDLSVDSIEWNGESGYKISISYGNTSRPSLCPEGYPDGAHNVVALLNKGYNAHGFVYGDWHGSRVASRQTRAGAHFIEDGIRKFMSGCAEEYGVTDIKVDGIYTSK